MEWINGAAVLIAAGLLLMHRGLVQDMAVKFAEAVDNFRGGPPSPMHPSPVNDAALLRRKRRPPMPES
jgi:hypothetical protein